MSVEITSFPLHEITNINFLQELNYMFYEDVGFKLQISFNGSKGYLSNISFSCEGSQSNQENRRVFLKVNDTLNKDGSIKKKIWIRLFHSNENGLTIKKEVL